MFNTHVVIKSLASLTLVVVGVLVLLGRGNAHQGQSGRSSETEVVAVAGSPPILHQWRGAEGGAVASADDSQPNMIRRAAHNEVGPGRVIPVNGWLPSGSTTRNGNQLVAVASAVTQDSPNPPAPIPTTATNEPATNFSSFQIQITKNVNDTTPLDEAALQTRAGRLGVDYQDGKVKLSIAVAGTVADTIDTGVIEIRKKGGSRVADLIQLPKTDSSVVGDFELRDIRNQGKVTIEVVALYDKFPRPELIKEFTIDVDTIGPQLVNAKIDGTNSMDGVLLGPKILLAFSTNDIKKESITDTNLYRIERFSDNNSLKQVDLSKSPTLQTISVLGVEKKVIQLEFDQLNYGVYRITIPKADQSGDQDPARPTTPAITDEHGNVAGGSGLVGAAQEQIVEVYPPRPAGKRVEFPEFLPTAPQPITERRINPADKVETAVVRLFYFRDAHRVAQLVNRNVRSLNYAAVTQAEQRASDARDDAEQLTLQRRAAEREAARDAEDLRQSENRLEDARRREASLSRDKAEALRQKQRNEEAIEILKEQLRAQPSPADPGQPGDPSPTADEFVSNRDPASFKNASWMLEGEEATAATEPSERFENARPSTLESRINSLLRANDRLDARIGEIEVLQKQQIDIEGQVKSLRKDARASNEAALNLAEQEELQKKNQFRAEVAAAHEDPDTYAAAELYTVDPVAQVSISVIGEGLIQLRGPSKGIDAIRTMIHQIDAPVGQVKVDVITVQVNGEDGAKMEKPVGKIDAHLKISRGLVSHSLMLLRSAVQQEATRIAIESDQGGHYQIDRDRKYLYAFFGRDFIDELYEMDSEFLNSENKVLGLHSMDTISLHQALFVLALAKNDVRQRILAQFMMMVRNDLVQAEFNLRRSAEVFPHKTRFWLPHHTREHAEQCSIEGISLNNVQRYHFTHVMNFFGAMELACGGFAGYEGSSDTLNPMQREFIRLAQIFKSRLVAELELKQRLIERTMIEDNVLNQINDEEAAANSLRPRVLDLARRTQDERLSAAQDLVESRFKGLGVGAQIRRSLEVGEERVTNLIMQWSKQGTGTINLALLEILNSPSPTVATRMSIEELLKQIRSTKVLASYASPRTRNLQNLLSALESLESLSQRALNANEGGWRSIRSEVLRQPGVQNDLVAGAKIVFDETKEYWTKVEKAFSKMSAAAEPSNLDFETLSRNYEDLKELEKMLLDPDPHEVSIFDIADTIYEDSLELAKVEAQYENAKEFLRQTRSSLERRKLLDFLIQEQEEKVIDLLEGTRARIAAMDGYLKRLSVALEDDFQVQFYDPAFVRIRGAARHMNVTFGQIERTSVLTNNRAFAKVSPAATMEFDLPKRNIAIVEALDGAKAIAQDFGPLLQDPTFLAAFQMMGGAPSNGKVQDVLPGLPSSGDEQQMGFTQVPDQQSGAALQSLVPDPSVYKIETGTGYEIRPVIQPDGISVVYDFNYMYTTNVREPVQADEKHLGRVKRHFIDTQVQTTSFELRRVSRYQVALKTARTSQGVPLLQDIPGVGALFRPAPSAESAIQENIILSQSVVYPTVFDVMGLRWAPSVVDLNHISVRDSEHVVRGRQQTVKNSVFENTTRTVDDVLGLNKKDSRFNRPDLYHRQTDPSPYHPGGYVHPELEPDDDPSGRGFMHLDRRPTEMRDPPYDYRRRVPQQFETETYSPETVPAQIDHAVPGFQQMLLNSP
ncbi:hypothetical protein Enr13x_08560 [Stieleria neptunia]|uniref:Uncharacterized protein n=1 Tax=Stieleria neptunia TaxID=2527979 RepID=A0A518HJJ4_9BACT|nr:hypothetical protein [Stieleria neptunia]QDV41018.1 hypothetical protein Enr13x_08560 [Stieleria neptunia]